MRRRIGIKITKKNVQSIDSLFNRSHCDCIQQFTFASLFVCTFRWWWYYVKNRTNSDPVNAIVLDLLNIVHAVVFNRTPSTIAFTINYYYSIKMHHDVYLSAQMSHPQLRFPYSICIPSVHLSLSIHFGYVCVRVSECEYQYYGAYFTVNTCSQIQWHTRLFSMIFLHICSEWMDRVAFKCTHNSHLQFECINFAQWAKSWMRYSNKEYGDRLGKTGWLQIQTEHTDTHTLNERKWEKRKRKTKNQKQKNV